MENTGKILFEDDSEQWFLSKESGWVGPLKASEIYQRVQGGEITPVEYTWKEGMGDWERICDISIFNKVLSSKPSSESLQALQSKVGKGGSTPPPPKKADDRIWFLFYNETQFGPFAESEIERLIEVGQVRLDVHAWKEGMGDWVVLGSLSQFKTASASTPVAPPVNPKKLDKRDSPRKPFMAKIILTDDNTIISGLCRDISIGGMQILTDKLPGAPGAQIRVNVNPDSTQIDSGPFVAEGTVVRILEDRRGFSFRFKKISDEVKDLIVRYIQSED